MEFGAQCFPIRREALVTKTVALEKPRRDFSETHRSALLVEKTGLENLSEGVCYLAINNSITRVI